MSRFTLTSEYAVTLFDGPHSPFRPLRGTYIGQLDGLDSFEIHDPDDPLDFPTVLPHTRLVVHGEWDHVAHPRVGAKGRTWADIAADQMVHLQRQRDLAERLTKIGIPRDPEPYWVKKRPLTPVLDQSLVLNYDELDLLLRRGGA